MRTLDELKRDSKNYKQSDTYGPSADDPIYQKYLAAKPKVAGGTANPTISANPQVRANQNLTKKPSETYAAARKRNRAAAAKLSAGLENAKATAQEVKDILFSGRNYGTVNPTFSLGKEYDTMTPSEAGAFLQLTKQGKTKQAEEYLKALQMELNERNAEVARQRAKETAEKSTLGGVGLDVAGAASSGAGALYSLWQEARGKAIDPYHPAFGGVIAKEGAHEGLMGDSKGVEKFLKEAALATAEWGGQALGFGALTPVVMAAGAAGSSTRDAALRGGTTEEATMYGLLSGTAEMVAEKIGFDRLFRLGETLGTAGVKGLLKDAAKSMAPEAAEEALTEVANILSDVIVMGNKSNMAQIMAEARANGATDKEALQAAIGQGLKDIAYSGGLGAVSGGMIGGGVSGLNRVLGRNALDSQRMPANAVDNIVEEVENGAELTNNGAEMPGIVTKTPVLESKTPEIDNKTPESGMKQRESETPEIYEELEDFGEKFYGEKGKEVFLRRARESGNLDHTPAFNTYYRAGVAGITESEIKQTAYTAGADKMLLNEAYMAGAMDRKTEIANAINGRSKLSGRKGLILGEDVKATEAQLAITKLYAEVGGVRIRLVNKIDEFGEEYHINGMQEGDTITIALNADSFMGTLHHEMVHYIRKINPPGYDSMRELVFNLANKSGIDMDKQMEAYRERYTDAYGEDADMMMFMEEMVADAFEKITNDQTNLANLCNELRKANPTLLERIKEFLDQMVGFLESLLKDNTYTAFAEEISKDKENLKKLRKEFAKALTETGKMEAEDRASAHAEGARYSITLGMTEEERYQELKDRDILVYSDTETEKHSKDFATIEELHKTAKNSTRKEIKKLAEKLGVLHKEIKTPEVEFEFILSGEGLRESFNKQTKYGGSYLDFAKAIANLDKIMETAVLLEEHEDKYKGTERESRVLEKVSVLFGAFRDGADIIPVQMEIKKSSTDGGRLYMTVAMTKIEAGVIETRRENPEHGSLLPTSTYRLAEIFREINVADKHFLKYVPEKFLNKEQRKAKKEALQAEVKKIANMRVRNDSKGRKLSAKQREYFKNSAAVDENGKLLVMYHGTRKGGFTTFRDWTYLTPEKGYAERYTDKDTGETMYEVYANIQKPFDTRIPEVREIFENEFFGNYSRTPLQETGLPDWTDGYDLAEFIEENEYDFDGILLDEGADPGANGETIERGISYVVRSSEQIKRTDNLNPTKDRDIRFSMSKPVEETESLIAVHNLSEENLNHVLDLGGFAMPSIAIVKDNMEHSKYGDISVVFGKETIDPEMDGRNAVYGGDAWTPTIPGVNYAVNKKKKEEFESEIENLASKILNGMFANSSLFGYLGIDAWTDNTLGQLVDRLANLDPVMAAYAADHGIDVEIAYQKKKYDQYGNAFLQKIIDHFGYQKLAELNVTRELGQPLNEEDVAQIREIWKQDYLDTMPRSWKMKKTPEQLEERAEQQAQKIVDDYRAGLFAEHAWQMYEEGGGNTEEIDRLGTQSNLNNAVNHDDVAAWVMPKLDGLLGESGIYNGKDPYTASGNRRTFRQLHYPYTLENMVKAMQQAQKERGEGLWGATASGLQSVVTPRYGSIEEVRADKSRLQMMDDEKYQDKLDTIDSGISEVIGEVRATNKPHSSNSFIEADIIGTVLIEGAGKKTAQAVKNHFKKEGYTISDALARKIMQLYKDAASLPTGYFEAKPQRAVGFDEVRAVVVPDNMEQTTRDRLESRGLDVIEYAEGDNKSRLQALNSVRDVKFSARKNDIEAAIAESEHWKKAYEGLLKEFEITKEPLRDREAAKKVVRKFLKSIQSSYDEEKFLDRFVSLCNYGADMQGDSNYRDLVTAMTMLAEDALRESAKMDMEAYHKYADLRKELRSATLYVSADTVKDLEAQDIKYNELRTENFNKVKISRKSGGGIDTHYETWAEKYPELFKLDQHTSQAALLMDIVAVRKSLDPVVKNPYFEQLEDYAESFAYELLGMMNDIALEDQTFADKYEEKLRKQREESRQALKNAKEQAKNEKKLLREKYATNAEARIEAIKQKYEKRLDRKEYWRLRKLAVKDAKALAEWLKTPTDKNHVPKVFKESVETVLALIDTDKPDLRIPLKSFVAMRGGLMELYGDTKGIYLYVEQDDQVINILDRFIQKYPDGANLDTMDGTDMKYFRNLIASVKKACMDANKMHTSQRERTAVSVSEGFINASQAKKDARETGMNRRVQDFLGLEMLDANSFFKRIGGDVYTELWKGLRKGMDKKVMRWKETIDFINNLVDPKDVRAWTDEAAKEFEIGGVKVYLTIPQIMSLACLMRRSQGRQHIIGMDIPTETGILQIKGGGFKAEPLGKDKKAKLEKAKVVEPNEAEVRAIIATLTEKQARVAYAMQQYLSKEVAAWGNETSMMMFGYEKFLTENYFPIVSDKNFVNQLVTKVEDIAPSLRSMGITRNVNQYANNPVIIQDIFKVFANHVDQMSNYNAFVASESDFNKFMNYKVKRDDGRIYSVKDEMDRTMGAGGAKYIKTLMNRLVTTTGLSDDSDFAKMFVRNMKVASVGANLRVIVQQPTAYLRAANYLDLKYLLNPAIFKKTDREIIYRYAPIALWKSWGNYEMDTGKTMYEQIIAPTKFAWTKEKLMAGAGAADSWTWSRLWNACELEARDKHPGLSDEEIYKIAGERFGEIVDESQVVDSILHRSQIMRKKGLYTQMATSFMSEPTKTFNMASNALVELLRNNTPENRKKFARCYMTIIATGIATACAAGLVDAMRDDDDEEEFLEKWKKAVRGDYSEAETAGDKFVAFVMDSNISANLNIMNMIPYLRDVWSLIQGYDIKRTDFDWLNDILKSMKRWENFIAGESEYTLSSMLMNTAGAVSKMAGIPIGSATRDLKAMSNLIVLHIIGEDEAKYKYRKLSKDIGSAKNTGDYVERMLQAKFSGNDGLATRIYNEMIAAGISNEKIDSKIDTKEKALLKEEPAAAEAAEAYAAGNYNEYMKALDSLTAKGYGQKNAVSVIESIYNKENGSGQEEAETFETITEGFWDGETEEETADYEMIFNAYMNGSKADYNQMWDVLKAAGKEEKNIKQSMRNRLKKAYQAAKAEGNYQEAQKAKSEFLRLGGKPETLEKE